jgi:hypothetical protein
MALATRTTFATLGTALAVAMLFGPPVLADRQAPAPVTFALVVHQSNPVNDLTMADLRRIFMLETQTWPHGRKITLVLGEKGQPGRAEIIRVVCGISEADYDRHLLLQTFRGTIGWGPRAIRSPAAMQRFVFNAPGAIAYLPADVTDSTTKVLRIDGLLPGDPQYPVRVHANGKPSGD